MTIQNEIDYLALRKVGKAVATTLETMKARLEPGMTTAELDAIGKSVLESHGARSAPIKDYNFPGNTCISINHEAAHGIPSDRVIQAGDLINIDVSAELDGYYADTGFTLLVQGKNAQLERLLACSQLALQKGIAQAKADCKLNQIGKAIENEAHRQGFTTIRNLAGHGTGRKLHEAPKEILNYYDAKQKGRLRKGMVIAIETFVSNGATFVDEGSDGWTLLAPDGCYVAQYEHTLVVTDGEPIILTRP